VVDAFERLHEFKGGQRLREVAAHPLAKGGGDDVFVVNPRVHRDLAREGVGQYHVEVGRICLALRERVEQGDVDVDRDRLVGSEFDHLDPVAITREHVGDADDHHVVVVNNRKSNWRHGSSVRER
jgi:hypothetical protein